MNHPLRHDPVVLANMDKNLFTVEEYSKIAAIMKLCDSSGNNAEEIIRLIDLLSTLRERIALLRLDL